MTQSQLDANALALIERAMRTANPRSYYVCMDEAMVHRVAFAARIRIFDLQIIGETTYKVFASNPLLNLPFPIVFDPLFIPRTEANIDGYNAKVTDTQPRLAQPTGVPNAGT